MTETETEKKNNIRKARLEIMSKYGLLLWDEAAVRQYLRLGETEKDAYIERIKQEDGTSGWMEESEDKYAAAR